MRRFKYLIGGLCAALALLLTVPESYASDVGDGVGTGVESDVQNGGEVRTERAGQGAGGEAGTESVHGDNEMLEEELSLNINHLGGYGSAYMFADEISTFALDVESMLRQKMAAALEQLVFEVDVSDLGLKRDAATVEMLTDIATDILNSDYRYFFISGFSYLYDQNNNIGTVKWICDSSYLISGTKEPDIDRIRGEISVLEAALDKALDCVDSRMCVVEKVLAVHDYIVRECDYDQENYVNNTVSVHSYSAWGVLVDGKAVCQGYAETFGAMMKALGIDCCLVASPSMNHIWNMVYIDGAWYHVDATWDDPVMYGTTAMGLPNNDDADEGYCTHKSFLKSDSEMTALGYSSWDDSVPDASVSRGFGSYCFYNVASDMSYYNTYWYYLQSPGTICRAKIDGSDKRIFAVGDGAYIHLLGNVLYYSDSKGVYSFDPATGSSTVYFSADKAYPGYTLTEFAVKKDQMIGVLYDGSGKFLRVVLEETGPAEPESSDRGDGTQGGGGQTGDSGQTDVSQNTGTQVYDDPVEQFVARLYEYILDRSPDAEGLASWTKVLKDGREQGAKVAQGFIDSDEFKRRTIGDEEYLKILYRTFFDREPDSQGLQAWANVLDEGLSRLHVFKGFAESDEFTQVCREYGITRGSVALTAPRDQNEGVTKFLVRCYRLCLGREADEDGLNAWCTQILTGANTAKEAAWGFVFSDEFKEKNLSDQEFVKMLYRVFMDREADAGGLNDWIRVLESGQSREHVFNGFADSPEFQEICREYEIQ